MMIKPEGKEVISLRRVAARFIAKNEKDGLDELDQITSSVRGKVNRKYLLWLFAVTVATIFGVGIISVSIAIAFAKPASSNAAIAVGGFTVLLYAALVFSWRFFQYGFGLVQNPGLPFMANVMR